VNRIEIKELAKTKIKGNKWNILWPLLAFGFVEGIIEKIFKLDPYTSVDFTNLESMMKIEMTPKAAIGSAVLGLLFVIVFVAYKKYIMNFVRTGQFDFKDIVDCFKEKWLNILVSSVLTYIVVFVCSMIFVIPGIIMALAYSMVAYVVVDSDLNGVDSMKKSRAMMKGYKGNYFVFGLSFIGWALLVPFTFGILLIWLVPYMTIADCIYYEKLKEITKN